MGEEACSRSREREWCAWPSLGSIAFSFRRPQDDCGDAHHNIEIGYHDLHTMTLEGRCRSTSRSRSAFDDADQQLPSRSRKALVGVVRPSGTGNDHAFGARLRQFDLGGNAVRAPIDRRRTAFGNARRARHVGEAGSATLDNIAAACGIFGLASVAQRPVVLPPTERGCGRF
jgi:hypothetical protein